MSETTPNLDSPDLQPSGLAGVRAIAFDCYGTLIDHGEAHFVDAMGAVCLRNALSIEGRALWDRWLAMSKELWRERGRDPDRQTEGPEPRFGTYDEIWTEQFERVFHELEMRGDAKGAYALMRQRLSAAPPYPEVHTVIDRLRGRFPVCVLSNADDDWLHPCLDAAGLRFEHIVSSESARSYKPRRKIFHDTAALLGVAPAELLYVGDSPVADVLGARHAGLPVAWVNRFAATLPDTVPAPDLEIADLSGLLAPLGLSEGGEAAG